MTYGMEGLHAMDDQHGRALTSRRGTGQDSGGPADGGKRRRRII